METSRGAPHLEIGDLRVGFKTYEGYKQVLRLSELHVNHGEAYGLVGESGSGKSVLALSIMRLLHIPPAELSASRLVFQGHDLLALSEREMRRLRGREMAMVFQDPMSSLNPVYTVGSQLLNIIERIQGIKGKQAHRRAVEHIDLVGLPDPENMLGKYPHELSGGQRQRVIIALALCCDARFLIADEPTRNLDVTVQAGILRTLARLQRELGVSLLFIANNLGLVSAMCDRVGILLEGHIVERGSVQEIVHESRHPYTHMLLRAIPSADTHASRTEAAIGEALPAIVREAEHGCPYYSRCPDRDASCEHPEPPELLHLSGTHDVACHAAVS